MSQINFVPDLFIGSQEINKFQDFIFDEGFIKVLLENSIDFGIVNKDVVDGNWTNFRIEQGTNAGTIKNDLGVAIDNSGRFVRRAAIDNISIPNDNVWKWIKVSYLASPIEPYTVSISATGSLSAPGGSLLSILRGLPNNPVYVSFPNGASNIGEYQVVEVVDNENAVLAGDFSAESNLQLAVVGAHTPDTITPTLSKYPFQYDSCVMTLVTEAVLNTAPTITDGEEFWLARVKRNGSTITIEDKRGLNVYRSKPDFELNNVVHEINPLIGVESVRYNGIRTERSENVVTLAWSFRSSNHTYLSSTNTVTLLGGNGGKYKTTANFVDGDFDGWCLWTENGKKHKIKQSSVAALQINIVLETLDPDSFTNTTQEIIVAPDVEEIEIIAAVPPGESTLTERKFTFPINLGEVRILLPVYKETVCTYIISYRYKNFKQYSIATLIPDDEVSGYYVESAFDNDGVLSGATKLTYTDGIISLSESGSSYANVVAGLISGDLFGVEYIAIDTAGDPIIDLVVGTTHKNVVVTNDNDLDASDADFGSLYTLTADCYFNLQSVGLTLKNGNSFWLQFRGNYDLDGNGMFITQDYVNGGNPGIILYTFTADDLAAALSDSLVIVCYWDGTRWFIDKLDSSIPDDSITNSKLSSNTIGREKVQTEDFALNNEIDFDGTVSGLVTIPGLQVLSGDSPSAPETGSGNIWMVLTTTGTLRGGRTANTYYQQVAIKIVRTAGDAVGMIARRGYSAGAWTGWSNINTP